MEGESIMPTEAGFTGEEVTYEAGSLGGDNALVFTPTDFLETEKAWCFWAANTHEYRDRILIIILPLLKY